MILPALQHAGGRQKSRGPLAFEHGRGTCNRRRNHSYPQTGAGGGGSNGGTLDPGGAVQLDLQT